MFSTNRSHCMPEKEPQFSVIIEGSRLVIGVFESTPALAHEIAVTFKDGTDMARKLRDALEEKIKEAEHKN